MKDGTIFVSKYRESNNFWSNLINKAIYFFTGKPYIHVEIWCDGFRYGSRENGPVRTQSVPSEENHVYLIPKNDLSDKQVKEMKNYLKSKLGDKSNYNHLKLITLAFVYPTRWFWKWIKWIPFEKDFHGVICSVYVDEAYKAAGINLLPDHYEEYTVPGDFLNSDKLRKI